MLEEAQEEVEKISKEFHKETVYTSAFFHSLLLEQLGQATHSYMTEGRNSEEIPEDIGDVIVCCLAYYNWLDKDASEAFECSLKKHERVIEKLKSENPEA